MQDIEQFIEQFYKNISFAAGEEPDFSAFLSLFEPGAPVFRFRETEGTVADLTTIENHIHGMLSIFEAYPQIKAGGFYEKAISNEIVRKGCMALVVSKYEKSYTREARQVVETGTNTMQLVYWGERWRVLSVGYSEFDEKGAR